jgi:hypothetical protein
MKTKDLPAVTLINPWSGASCQQMIWVQIRRWATKNVHSDNRREWLDAARKAYQINDGETIGSMIIGS